MKRVNEYYYICEKGHITVGGSGRKIKCSQEIREVKLVKKGKAKIEKEVLKTRDCGEEIKEILEMPEELVLTEEWNYRTVRAFMTGQSPENLKIKFIQLLQSTLSGMNKKIEDINKSISKKA